MNEAVFKTTVMGGFNKSDVLAFIDKQDKRFREREKDLSARIDSLSTSLKSETQRADELKKQVEQLEVMLQEERSKSVDALEKLHAIGLEVKKANADYTSDLESRDAEIEKLKSEIEDLRILKEKAEDKAENAAAYAAKLEDKLALIDKTQEQIGRALLEAQQTADNIVGTAKEQANEILNNAHKEAADLIDEAHQTADRIKGEAKEKLDELLSGVEDYKNRVITARADAAKFFEAIDSVFESMEANSEDILDKFGKAFKIEETADTIGKEEAAVLKFDFSDENQNT